MRFYPVRFAPAPFASTDGGVQWGPGNAGATMKPIAINAFAARCRWLWLLGCAGALVGCQSDAAGPEPTSPKFKEFILGRWDIPKSGNVSFEFTKDGRFTIRHGDRVAYRGQYEVFKYDGEIGLNKVEDGNGKTVHLSYMSGARAQVVIKLSQFDGSLILERPKVLEWSLKVGTVYVPPYNFAQLKLVRMPEGQTETLARY